MESEIAMLTCRSGKCCSESFIAAPGNDPTSTIGGCDDFFGMLRDVGMVCERSSVLERCELRHGRTYIDRIHFFVLRYRDE